MSSRPMPPIAPERLPTWSSVSVAPAPLKVAAFVGRRRCGEHEVAPASILQAARSADGVGQRQGSARSLDRARIGEGRRGDGSEPLSVDPAASVSDAPEAVAVSVPPPSWITPSLVIAAPAVVQSRPASNSSSPLAPIVRSVVSIVL